MWPRCDQLRKVAEEQRQQQHLDVRAVDVGIGQDADLAVAQPAKLMSSFGPCGSTPIATAMSWISVLANRRSRSTSQVLSTLPRSGRIAWVSLSRPILAEPPAESPSTRNNSLRASLGRLAIGQLAGQHGDAGALVLLDLLAGALRAPAPAITTSSASLRPSFDVLVEPELELRAHEERHQPHRVAAEFSRSLIWPWNCGSSTFADSTKLARANTSSGISLTPFGSS